VGGNDCAGSDLVSAARGRRSSSKSAGVGSPERSPVQFAIVDLGYEEMELARGFCNVSVTQLNRAQGSSIDIQTPEGSRVKLPRGRGRAWSSPGVWAGWAEFSPTLFMAFPFLFLPRLKNS
jgi:hypothetical protein